MTVKANRLKGRSIVDHYAKKPGIGTAIGGNDQEPINLTVANNIMYNSHEFIDWTGTKTRQIFSRLFAMANKYGVVCPYLK